MIKLSYIFESYPVFYQPYIDPIVDFFKNENSYNLDIIRVSSNQSKFKRKLNELTKVINSKILKSSYTDLQKNILKQDIVHIQHSYLFSHVKKISKEAEKNRPKLVITLRGADTFIKPLINKKWSDFYREDFMDAYVVMSNDQKAKLQSLGIKSKKIYVIPISFGKPFSIEPKKVNQNKIKIISAFRLCWEKNINANLLVVKEIVEKGYSVKYDIYGSGAEKKMLFYLIDKYKLENSVFYKGAIPNDELKSKFAFYDFYLQLSLSESFGMSVVEAQTYGLPAITSNVGGLPDIVVDGKTGFTVNPNSYKGAATNLLNLWKDEETYTEFSSSAIKYSQENFNTQQETNKLIELYKSLIHED
jgi:glycosyltransferase involved in cell wall biosynthesis